MKKQIGTLVLATLMAAGSALAMDHSKMNMDHASAMADEHKQMIRVGEQTVDGVEAMVHLNDVKATMAKMGMKETHHLMIMFEQNDKKVTDGTVAVKIKGPDGKEGEAIKLMGMEGHFGADVVLAAKGHYTFTFGTKLADGKNRKFELSWDAN